MASHNPKVDLAKRQAVGCFRPVARFATKAEGDFRPVEGAKPCYQTKPAPAVYDPAMVKRYHNPVAYRPERPRANSIVGTGLNPAILCDVKHKKVRDVRPVCLLRNYKQGASVLIPKQG